MTIPPFAPIPAALPATVPFVGPETLIRQRGAPFAARLGANENGFGPSPRAVAAMAEAAARAWCYGNSTSHDLRVALAAHHGVTPDHIVVGEGIDGLLGLAVRLFVAPGDGVVTSLGGYPTFTYHVAGFGGVTHAVPYRDDAEDAPALVDAATRHGARLIYLANPDNPMGSWLTGAQIEALLPAIPPGAVLILDEAYADFAPPKAIPTIAPDTPNVIRFRTFSKAYGMAGARIAYAIAAAPLATAFNKVRNHFGVNRIAQEGALAALEDQAWLELTKNRVAEGRERLAEIATANGLTALPSATNFVAIDCGRDGAFAKAVLDGLISRNIFVRMPFVEPQNRCIRVSAGRPEDLDAFEAALPGALADAG